MEECDLFPGWLGFIVDKLLDWERVGEVTELFVSTFKCEILDTVGLVYFPISLVEGIIAQTSWNAFLFISVLFLSE